ncbi:MAG TPA: CHAT domain-containing protein [Pirellulales bacterium]|jgi:tetratricopeptide (TPR) repeat protein|nr:CHAT domain-containing protein [Pirellulales bacterium]
MPGLFSRRLRAAQSGLCAPALSVAILLFTVLLAVPARTAPPAAAGAGQTQQVPVVIGAQVAPGSGRSYPAPSYFFAFNSLNDGDYRSALEQFTRELRGAYRNGQNRWIDSICDYTMVGECDYRLGDYSAALENFNAALQLYMTNSDWMLRVQFPPTLGSSGASRGAPWGKSSRGSAPARFSETLPIAVGMFDANQVNNVLQRGGVLQAPMYLTVNVQEIVRCTCLAMMRRQDILGQLITHDTLTDEVLSVASRRQGPPNHWSEAWLDAMQGTAYNSAGKGGQALALLKRSLLMQGQFDHPLTGLALLQLGQLAMDGGDNKIASGYFEEATYSGYNYSDATVIAEGFKKLFLAHLLAGDVQTLDTALTLAASWAHNKARELDASILLMAAESLAMRGQRNQAVALLAEATGTIGRRTMGLCEIGSQLNFLTALTQYQQGAINSGDTALTNALQWYKNGGSKWLFQIGQADNLCLTNPNGRYDRHVAMPLYATMLRDPTPADWTMQPIESLAVLATPHPLPFEHWFEIAMQQATSPDVAAQGALLISDLAKRHKFLSTQPFGGRMLALRWVLEAPPETLGKEAKLQRQDLLSRFPKYAEAADKVRQLRTEIIQAGVVPEGRDAQRAVSQKFTEVAALTTTQENMLHEMAVSRVPADMLFPPVRGVKEVQRALGGNKLLLMFFATAHAMYGGFYSGDRSSVWKIDNPALLEKRIATLLKSLGNFDANHELQEVQLTDDAWQQPAKDVLASVLANPKTAFNIEFKELIVVPDGLAWYVPFEILPMGDPKATSTLISRMRVRYAPTVGLAMTERAGRKPAPDLGVVAGKLYPNEPADFTAAAVEDIRHVAAHAIVLHAPLPAISPLVGAMLDGVVVLDDIPMPVAQAGPYEWSPLPVEKNKGIGALSAWLGLPWKNADVFILPSFHTAAENSLKNLAVESKNGITAGSDLFLATTGLMATGARTILISRWRTGGQTCVDLVRQFIQELPFSSADAAWQRAVELVSQSPLDPQHEPRVKRKPDAPPTNAQSPFFWAGYLLIDSGVGPEESSEQPKDKPLILKFDVKNIGNDVNNAAGDKKPADGKEGDAKSERPKLPEIKSIDHPTGVKSGEQKPPGA